MNFTRRGFLAAAAMSSASVAVGSRADAQAPGQSGSQTATPPTPPAAPMNHMHNHPKPEGPVIPRLPALISRMTNTLGTDAAYQMLKQGGDTLDAALQVTTFQEDDPDDSSTGLGGLPNQDCEVELDACVWHGPTRRTAAVASVSGIRNASLLARAVMQHTGYSLLCGADAQRFGVAQGFKKQDLITERTRKEYLVWKQIQASPAQSVSATYDPNWPGPGGKAHFLEGNEKDLDLLVRATEPLAVKAGIGPQFTWRTAYDALFPGAEPLYIGTINARKEMSSAATTSGLPWRMAGAAGDIGVLGAGSYLDPEVGSAGSSGNAEANIRLAGARMIVENMRKGMSPEDAGMEVLERIVHWYKNDMAALRFVEMVYYILRSDGAYGSVTLWRGDRTGHVRQFTIHDGIRRAEDCRFLFDASPTNGCAPCTRASAKSMHDM